MTNPKPKNAMKVWRDDVERHNKRYPEGSKLYLQDVIEELDQRLRQLEKVAEPPRSDLSYAIRCLGELAGNPWHQSTIGHLATLKAAIAILERAQKDGGK